MGGVHTVENLVRSILAGSDVTMLALALIQHGSAIVLTLLEGLATWIDARHLAGVSEGRGLASFRYRPQASGDERADYTEELAMFANRQQYRTLRI